MLGYIYSAITLFAGTAKGYCGKRISEFTTKISDAIHISALRMAVSAIFGFLFLLLQGKFSYMGLSVSSAFCGLQLQTLPLLCFGSAVSIAMRICWLK